MSHEQVIAEIEEDMQSWALQALNATQLLALNYVRGEGGTTSMGAEIRTSEAGQTYYHYSRSLPRRDAHPGFWADVTGITANLYDQEEPKIDSGRIVGSLINTAEHAEDLEGKPRKEGSRYWVLAGLDKDAGFQSEFHIADVFEQQFNALVDDN